MEFEWDSGKSAVNLDKHGVSFEEAQSIFDDLNWKQEYDIKHSQNEDRWLGIGVSQRLRLVTVAYTKRYETIRIISARRANQAEASRYSGEA